MKRFSILLVFVILLNGCARKDPVDSVIDHHHDHITDVLDYAYNNIDQTKDVIFLENELKSCDLALIDVKQTYYGQISACNERVSYWKLATLSLFVALCALIFARIKRLF